MIKKQSTEKNSFITKCTIFNLNYKKYAKFIFNLLKK